jgi:hypothetical protein
MAMSTNLTAEEYLRGCQASFRQLLGFAPKWSPQEVLNRSLEQAQKREEQSVRQGEFIREAGYKYPAGLEELRWQQTRDVIRRVAPGMDEDPVYLEMLARQAASVEIILCQKDTGSPNPKAASLCERVLIGTTVQLDPEAWEHQHGDRFLVLLSYGLISFLYQAAKAVVLSWRLKKAPQGVSLSFGVGTEDILAVLEKNPYPLELLYKTLHGYLFKGYPRATLNDPPPPEYHPPLSLLTNFVERFVIAHEYGHAFSSMLDSKEPARTPWQKEFGADTFAFFATMESGAKLDLLPPNMALQGVLFSLSGLEMIYQALDIVRFGAVQKDMGSTTHPPIQQRKDLLKELYHQYVGDDEKDQPQEAESGQKGAVSLDIEGALPPSNTLKLLWERIQPRFLEAYQQGSILHPIWG